MQAFAEGAISVSRKTLESALKRLETADRVDDASLRLICRGVRVQIRDAIGHIDNAMKIEREEIE